MQTGRTASFTLSSKLEILVIFVVPHHLLFVSEQFDFCIRPARSAEAADFAVAAYYPVAGDNQRQGIFGKRIADGSCSFGASHFFCKGGIC